MKKISIVLLALACMGCAAAASQGYRPDPDSREWQIEGVQSGFGRVQIKIDGQPVMEGKISMWSGEGKFSGTYQGKPLDAACDKGTGYVRSRCVLTMNGEKFVTLYFRPL